MFSLLFYPNQIMKGAHLQAQSDDRDRAVTGHTVCTHPVQCHSDMCLRMATFDGMWHLRG